MIVPEIEMEGLFEQDGIGLYRIASPSAVDALVLSTPHTRRICNDPTCAGVEYTRLLSAACAIAFRLNAMQLQEHSTAVVNILRGGLNFGLREALADAFGWNCHSTCFISAQRARDSVDSEDWHITENSYAKVYLPEDATLVIGDVVATGTSLRYALQEMLKSAVDQKISLRSIVFFTIGGGKALEILDEIDGRCRQLFPGYAGTTLFYIEGCFTCAEAGMPLTIRLTGTDLLRRDAVMAPQFVESQYENPAYPLERCVIYDAGSRAFWVREYARDVIEYWSQNLQLAEHGMTFRELLSERFPQLDPERFDHFVDLRELCRQQIDAMKQLL